MDDPFLLHGGTSEIKTLYMVSKNEVSFDDKHLLLESIEFELIVKAEEKLQSKKQRYYCNKPIVLGSPLTIVCNAAKHAPFLQTDYTERGSNL